VWLPLHIISQCGCGHTSLHYILSGMAYPPYYYTMGWLHPQLINPNVIPTPTIISWFDYPSSIVTCYICARDPYNLVWSLPQPLYPDGSYPFLHFILALLPFNHSILVSITPPHFISWIGCAFNHYILMQIHLQPLYPVINSSNHEPLYGYTSDRSVPV